MPQRYSLAAIILHWAIAALLAFQIAVGWALGGLGARGFTLYQLHKSVGITILALTILRIVIRYWKPRPPAKEGGWQGALASGVHFGLYAFMLAAPLTGWALVSTAKVKVPTLIFGILPLPPLPLPASAHEAFENGHGLIAWIGIALFLLHVAGALRHHLLIGDGLIWRMVPGRSRALLLALPALILIGFVAGRAIVPAGDAPASPARSAAADEEVAGAPAAWSVQPGGTIHFSVGNDGETISGNFSKWTARIVMDPDRPETADIQVTIDMASASVGDAYKDGMLPNEEFLATAAHPTATFTAKGAEATSPGRYQANGTLTLKGVSKPQTIRFSLSGAGATRRVRGIASIARAAFGVGNGESSGSLAPQVAVTFDFSARRQD